MADIKISALPVAADPDGTEIAPVVQGGTTKQMLLSQIYTWIVGGIVPGIKALYLDAATTINGAGAVGFLYATAYAGNTVGAWLKGLATSTGATFIGYLAPFAGTQLRTQAVKNSDTISILEFSGVDPTGVTDSTAGATAFVTACRAQGGDMRVGLWRKGTYLISGQISTGSNITIIFEPGVVINFTGDINTPLFAVANQTSVFLYGNGTQLNGNRAGVTLSDTGNQNAIYVYGSDNVLIQDFNIANFAVDGITVTGDNGASGPSTNVRVIGCDVYNSGRNGLSIIHAIGMVVMGGRYWNSNGAPSGPWAGIDVEPNANENVKGLVITGVRTQSNDGAGIQFTPGAMSVNSGTVYDVAVYGGRSTMDGNISGLPGLRFANGSALTNEVQGQVVVRDFVIESPKAMGVSFQNWDAVNAPRVLLDGVLVINPNGASGSTGNPNQSGFVIYTNSTQTVTAQGKITLRNCKAEDSRATPKMIVGCYVAADTGKAVQDVLIQDFTSVNYLASAKTPVKVDAFVAGSVSDVVVTYAIPKSVSMAGSVTAPNPWAGQRVNLTTGGSNFALPLAASCRGLYFEVQCDQAAGTNCTVSVTGSDHIKANGVAIATTFTLQPGDNARLRSEGGAIWSVAPAG